MNCLVIGAGSIGRRHGANLANLGHEVQWYDVQPDMRSMELDAGLEWADAALVCTPPDSHVEYALRALEADCAVLIEKPITDGLNYKQRLPLSELAIWSEHKLVMAATNYRFHAAIRKAQLALKSIGNIIWQSTIYGHDINQWRPDWKRTYLSDVDAWLDSGIHLMDYTCWLLGGYPRKLELDRTRTTATATFKIGDTKCMLGVDWHSPKRFQSIEIHGTQGHGRWTIEPDDGDMHTEQIKHFIACCEGKEEPICPFDEAVAIFGAMFP